MMSACSPFSIQCWPMAQPGVRGEVFERGRVAGGGHDHDGVLQRLVRLERGHRLGHRRVLLSDGDVDALHALAGLVDDGVDGDRRLAGLAVTDDQLTLPPADRGHGIDGLDTGLHGLGHRLAADDARSLDLHAAGLGAGDRAFAVDGLAQRVHHAAQEGVADRHRLDPAGRLDGLLLFEAVHLAQDDGADGVLVQVEGQAQCPVLELEQFVHRGAGQARHAGDAVTDLDDPADLLGPDHRRVLIHVLLQRRRDLTGVDRQFCHQPAPSVCLVVPLVRAPRVWKPLSSHPAGQQVLPQGIDPAPGAGVHLQVADLNDGPAEQRLVDDDLELDRRPGQVAQRVRERRLLRVLDRRCRPHQRNAPAAGFRRLFDQPVQRPDDVAGPAAGHHVADQRDRARGHLALAAAG